MCHIDKAGLKITPYFASSFGISFTAEDQENSPVMFRRGNLSIPVSIYSATGGIIMLCFFGFQYKPQESHQDQLRSTNDKEKNSQKYTIESIQSV